MKALKADILYAVLIALLLPFPAHAQWTEPMRISIPGAYLYPQILAAGDTLHIVGTLLPGGDKVVYLRSDDAGDTWSDSQILSDTVNSTNAMFVRIVKHNQQIMVLWRSIMNSGPGPWNIGYALSHDNGDTWTEALYVLAPGWDHVSYFSASGDGPVVNVIVSRYIGYDLFFYSVRSTDFGQSWSEPVEIFRAAQSSLTDQAQFDNTVHYSWAGRFGSEGPWETYYIRSTDEGSSWSESVSLSEMDEFDSYHPSISVNELGYIGLSWMDFKYSPYWFTGDIFVRQSFSQGEEWTSELQVTEYHRSTLSDLVWSGDTVCVASQDERPENGRLSIYYSQSTDGGQSWSSEYRLDNNAEDSRNPGLAISNRKIYAIWADDRCDPDTDVCGGIYFTRLETEVGIEDDRDIVLPDNCSLDIYPNPFNLSVIIWLNIVKEGDTEIAIFDVNGRLVKSIFKGGNLEKGTHKFTWDATDAAGKAVTSGLYFAVARTPQGKISKTLTLIR